MIKLSFLYHVIIVESRTMLVPFLRHIHLHIHGLVVIAISSQEEPQRQSRVLFLSYPFSSCYKCFYTSGEQENSPFTHALTLKNYQKETDVSIYCPVLWHPKLCRKKACGAEMQLQLLKYFSQELDEKGTENCWQFSYLMMICQDSVLNKSEQIIPMQQITKLKSLIQHKTMKLLSWFCRL